MLMPILKKNNQLHYFAHIPKCGGTAIENYCIRVGINISFLDRNYFLDPAPKSWNISSPQHIDGYSFSRLFPLDFFDYSFAVIRNPISKFLSAFKFNILSKNIPKSIKISDFVKQDLKDIASKIGVLDNHFLPQVNFLMPEINFKIFKIESGLEEVKKFIDLNILGTKSNEKIIHENKTGTIEFSENQQFELDDRALIILKEIYYNDFQYYE